MRHIRHIILKGDHNNNKMERLNGEISDREKTMEGIKAQTHSHPSKLPNLPHYIRPHESLDGKTPAEAGGIAVEGKNKWLTLIQNASKRK